MAAVVVVCLGAWLGTHLGNVGASTGGPTLLATVTSGRAADAQAAQRNLRLQAAQPNPVSTAIRQVMPSGTPDETVRRLALTLNLNCVGRTPLPQAVESLQNVGVDAATARRILDATRTLQACRATDGSTP